MSDRKGRHRIVVGGVELGRGGQGIIETIDDLGTALRFANGGTKNVDNVVLVAVDLDDGRILRPIVKTQELSKWGDAVVFKRRLPGPFVENDDDMKQEFENILSLGQTIASGIKEGKLDKGDILALNEASSLLVLHVPSSATPPSIEKATHTVLVVGAQGKTAEDYPFYRRLSGNMLHLEATLGVSRVMGTHVMLATRATLRVLVTLRKVNMHHGDIKEENIMWLARVRSHSHHHHSPSDDVDFALGDFGMVPHVSAKQSIKPFGTPGYQCPLLFPDTEDGRMSYMSYYPRLLPSFFHLPSSSRGPPPSNIDRARRVWNSYVAVRSSKSLTEHDITEKNDLYGLGVTLARMIDSPIEIRKLATRLMSGGGSTKDALWKASDALDACEKILSEKSLENHPVYIPDSAATHEHDIALRAMSSQRRRAAEPFRSFSPNLQK